MKLIKGNNAMLDFNGTCSERKIKKGDHLKVSLLGFN